MLRPSELTQEEWDKLIAAARADALFKAVKRPAVPQTIFTRFDRRRQRWAMFPVWEDHCGYFTDECGVYRVETVESFRSQAARVNGQEESEVFVFTGLWAGFSPQGWRDAAMQVAMQALGYLEEYPAYGPAVDVWVFTDVKTKDRGVALAVPAGKKPPEIQGQEGKLVFTIKRPPLPTL